MTTTRTATAREPAEPALGPSRYPLPLPGWDGLGVTARVEPGAMTTLRRLRRGDVAELALAILDREVVPAFVGADRWRTDERGRLDARGTFVRVGPACSPGAMEVLGRRWALTEGVDARPGTRIEVAGTLDVTGGDRAAQLSRTWRVRSWRRYAPGRAGVPLATLPSRDDADPAARYVVDLEPV
ncbi:hypothetical protein LQ327_19130 [Actinomycetospora endophytica]|uniref:Uncharacterized protein n=1 Tax=Actinomycetospora endophytica TaxID=2291215 RepID=A0ABS8PB29_9PSEU|nr:hypothetical protein [Actinomycetospora endophytica]MCD2195486.1 hypothetical protein [Actinomycetospora endophytica]